MRTSSILLVASTCLSSVLASCGGEPPGNAESQLGSLGAAIELGPNTHDVAAVRFDIVPAGDNCDAPPLATQVVALEAETALESSEPTAHHFASSLFVLEPGEYRACATPLAADSSASAECAPATGLASVVPGESNRLALLSQCQGDASGGLGVSVTLNDPPQITALTVTESDSITICETASLAVSASDPNGDEVTYGWSVLSGPDGGSLRATDSSATFSGSVGEYVLQVAATDVHGAQASLSFSVRVSDATCVVPEQVHSILLAKCSPCHTSGASGGLKLDPADVAFASLVNHNVGAAACSGSVRVVPGEPENSYVVAKLRNAPGICGLQMPRGRPPLPEEEIQTIEAWIAALPH